MPTVFRFEGHRFFFFSNENDEPPHLHVEKAEAVAKFWLTPDVELAWALRYRGRDISKLQKLIEDRQDWFLEKWNEYFEEQT